MTGGKWGATRGYGVATPIHFHLTGQSDEPQHPLAYATGCFGDVESVRRSTR